MLRPTFDVKRNLSDLPASSVSGRLESADRPRPHTVATRLNALPQGRIPTSGEERQARSETASTVPLERDPEEPRPEIATPSVRVRRALSGERIRRRPTFPRSCPRSIIGPERLNCRVRNGNGCGPLGKVTGKSLTWYRSREEQGKQEKRGWTWHRTHQFKALWSSRTTD